MFGKSDDSITTSDVSALTIDVPKDGNPFSKMMSFCSPKAEEEEDDDDMTGFHDFGSQKRKEPEEEVDDPVLFDTGLIFQIVAMGVVVCYEAMA